MESHIQKFANKLQKIQNDEQYKNNSPSDKIECVICGKRYRRQTRSLHYKSRHHKDETDKIIETISSLFKLKSNISV